jgi:Ca-activated chloride channel family protein
MADDGKLLLSKDSVGAFINELGAEDRFELLTFNVQPNLAFKQLREATEQNKQEAISYLGQQAARGGTILAPAVTTAFKYVTPDRPLNVIILSDGLTEQQDRTTLLQLSQTRPGNTRIFCIGVGNDVNRPMLEQVADQTGGLAAFISRGDNFERQAKAFRRKLTRPAATGLVITIKGVETYDVEPEKLPNLYHGSPVRLYGRYKGSGKAEIDLRASVNGRELKKKVELNFPKEDAVNPEIERMWAWRRMDGLLKSADAKGNRMGVVPEVIRLGELYSIASEYTSFLVLENDAEYKRWQIARANLKRFGSDRTAQASVARQFEVLRNKSLAGLGPEAIGAPASVSIGGSTPQTASSPASGSRTFARADTASTPSSQPSSPQHSQSISFGGGGGGPVGPLFVGIVLLWRGLIRKLAHRNRAS